MLRGVLTFVAFFTVLFTRRIPRPLFDAIAMTFRYEWRAASYALFLRKEYPPFDFQSSADDDGADPHTLVTFTYPEQMSRWQPLVKWLLAIPHYLVLFALSIAAAVVVIAGFFAVLITGEYPENRAISWLVSIATTCAYRPMSVCSPTSIRPSPCTPDNRTITGEEWADQRS